jgi:hypothetical protein
MHKNFDHHSGQTVKISVSGYFFDHYITLKNQYNENIF